MTAEMRGAEELSPVGLPLAFAPFLRKYACRAGLIVSVVGGVVLLGWMFDAAVLKSVLPGAVSMKPNTAVAFVLAGAALQMSAGERAGTRRRRLAQMAAAFVSVIGLLAVAQDVLGVDFGIDEALFADAHGAAGTSAPGRMSVITAVNFIALGIATALAAARRAAGATQALALGAGLTSLLAVMGYAYGVPALYKPTAFTAIALHTALAFLILSAGVFLAHPERGLAAILASDTGGGAMVRRLMPMAVGASILLGWLRLEGQRRGLFDTEFGIALLVGCLVVVLTVVVLGNGRWLLRSESQRERAEAARRESEERFRATFEQAAVGIAHVAPDGRWLRVNRRLSEIVGYSHEELLERTFQDITHPDDLDSDLAYVRQMLAGEIPRYSMEKRYFRKDGRIVWINLTVSLVRDSTFRPRYFISVVEDITARKEAEAALQQLNRALSMLSECNQALIRASGEEQLLRDICDVIVQQGGYPLAWVDLIGPGGENGMRLAAYAGAGTPGGLDSSEVVWSEVGAGHEPVATAIRTGEVTMCFREGDACESNSWCRAAGPLGCVSCIAVPIMAGTEALGALTVGARQADAVARQEIAILTELAADLAYGLAVIRARAERDRAEEENRRLNAELEDRVRRRTAELEMANKEMEAFSHSVSHDLRAPLRAIDGFSKILMEDFAGALGDRGRHYLGRVRAGAERMGRLIDDLLGLSRISRGELRMRPVDLGRMAEDVAADLRATAPDRRVEFVIAPGLVADGDAGLLRIVLENLLGNAWKYTGKRARARIELGRLDGAPPVGSAGEIEGGNLKMNGPVFFVRDNGAGFNSAYAGKLFGPFQRLHAVTEFEGTGIGLATVERIIRRHGGRVWAEGAVEQGATFYFTLPGKQAG